MAEVIDSTFDDNGVTPLVNSSDPLSRDDFIHMKEQEDKSLWVFIAGIAGIFVPIASLVAVVLGFMYRKEPGLTSKGKIGFWLGIIVTILSIIGFFIFLLLFGILASSSDMDSTVSTVTMSTALF